jgi:transposase-like protein
MGLHAINVQVQLTEINCGECGGTYAINERYRLQQWQKGGSWTCPYCKTGWGYANDNENSRLKRALEEERQRKIAALARENEERIAREKLERKLKRVGRGVCPDCNRTFQNLARHMCAKHSEKK